MGDPSDREPTTEVLLVDLPAGAARPRRDRCSLTMLAGATPGMLLPMEGELLTFGRGEESMIRLEDSGLSRLHAQIVRTGGDFFIEDLESTNGTYVNGDPVKGRRILRDGDRLQMGSSVLMRFSLQDAVEQDAARRMYESAVRDPLTQVYNRRYLDERLEAEFAFAMRHQSPLTLMLLDLDHFKSINDQWGHLAGDAVLRVSAGALARLVRVEDLVARYGGEEFCVIARGTDARNGFLFADRMRKSIAALRIPWETDSLSVTVSIGLATYDGANTFADVRSLVSAADGALYVAKRDGRNRCSSA